MSFFGSAHIFYILELDHRLTHGVTQNIDEVVSKYQDAQLVFQKHFDQYSEAEDFHKIVQSWDETKVRKFIKGV